MIKFKSKESGVLKINDLLLQGYSKEDLRKEFGLEVFQANNFDKITQRETTVKKYRLNGKEGSLYSKHWNWREKLIIEMLG